MVCLSGPHVSAVGSPVRTMPSRTINGSDRPMIDRSRPIKDTTACQCSVAMHHAMNETTRPAKARGIDMKNTMQLEILRIPKEIPTIARTLAVVFSCGGMIFYRLVEDYSGMVTTICRRACRQVSVE